MAQARQISLLLNPRADAVGGKVYFYKVGTSGNDVSNLKTVWTDADKGSAAANPYTLSANGSAQLYGDGEYRVVIYNANDVLLDEHANLQYEPIDVAAAKLGIDVSLYGTNVAAISSAIAAASGNPKTIYFTAQNWVIDANLTIPSHINVQMMHGSYFTVSSNVTLTIEGVLDATAYSIFTGAGNVSISKTTNSFQSIWTSSLSGTVSYTSGSNNQVFENDASFKGNTDISTLKIGGVEVTSTAEELNLSDGSSAGTIVNSKGVVYGAGGEVNATKLQVSGADITATPEEINRNDGAAAETIVNNKTVVYGPDGQVNAKSLKIQGAELVSSDQKYTAPLILDSSATYKLVSKTASYTAANESIILVDASSGAVAINMPASSGLSGREYIIKKTDSYSSTVTITPDGSETIDGASSYVISDQYSGITIVSDGSNWFVVQEFKASSGADNILIENSAPSITLKDDSPSGTNYQDYMFQSSGLMNYAILRGNSTSDSYGNFSILTQENGDPSPVERMNVRKDKITLVPRETRFGPGSGMLASWYISPAASGTWYKIRSDASARFAGHLYAAVVSGDSYESTSIFSVLVDNWDPISLITTERALGTNTISLTFSNEGSGYGLYIKQSSGSAKSMQMSWISGGQDGGILEV